MLVDSHAHLEATENLNEALKSAERAGISKIITIGTDLKSSREASKLAISCSKPGLAVWGTVGIHPGDGKHDLEKLGVAKCVGELRRYSANKKIVAIGEAGLDYYEDTSNKEKEYQRELFVAQIKLSAELNLPLVVHCRNGWGDIFRLLTTDYGLPHELRGVFHSFTGGVKEAKKAIDIGFYVSFSGIVTFKNAKDIQEAAKFVPIEKMLVETDSPFLSPEPNRSQKNTPGNVKIIADFISQLRNVESSVLYAQLLANTQALFKI